MQVTEEMVLLLIWQLFLHVIKICRLSEIVCFTSMLRSTTWKAWSGSAFLPRSFYFFLISKTNFIDLVEILQAHRMCVQNTPKKNYYGHFNFSFPGREWGVSRSLNRLMLLNSKLSWLGQKVHMLKCDHSVSFHWNGKYPAALYSL